MAYSDYAQSQIVNQFQAYFQVKHAAYNDFLPEIDPNNLTGDPADPDSTLNQALEALRNRLPGGNKIAPDDPDYLQKMYQLASRDLATDYSARSVLNITLAKRPRMATKQGRQPSGRASAPAAAKPARPRADRANHPRSRRRARRRSRADRQRH